MIAWLRLFITLVTIALAVFALTGCAPKSVIPYPAMSPDDAARTIADRLAFVRTLSARCEITLTDPQGDSIRLDGALAAASPDRMRLRAWKFDQAVFDLTLTPDGLWLFQHEDSTGEPSRGLEQISAAQIGRAWTILTGGFFAGRPSSVPLQHGRSFLFASTAPDGTTVSCTVDRSTLTPTSYALQDSAGMHQYSVYLSRYETVGGIAWPTRLDFHSAAGEVLLRLNEIEINGDISPSAFVPPSRAVKLP